MADKSYARKYDPLLTINGIPEPDAMASVLRHKPLLECILKAKGEGLPSPSEYNGLVKLLRGASPGLMELMLCMANGKGEAMPLAAYKALHQTLRSNKAELGVAFWELCREKNESPGFQPLYKYCYKTNYNRTGMFRSKPSAKEYRKLLLAAEGRADDILPGMRGGARRRPSGRAPTTLRPPS